MASAFFMPEIFIALKAETSVEQRILIVYNGTIYRITTGLLVIKEHCFDGIENTSL